MRDQRQRAAELYASAGLGGEILLLRLCNSSQMID